MATYTSTGSNVGYVDSNSSSSGAPGWVGNWQSDYENGYFRFPNVTVAQGATITSASMVITYGNTDGPGTVNFTLKMAKVANAVVPASYATYPTIPRTTASSTSSLSTGGGTSGTIDLSGTDYAALIQEVVNQGTWASGNAMMLFLEDNGSTADTDMGVSRVDLTINTPAVSGGNMMGMF